MPDALTEITYKSCSLEDKRAAVDLVAPLQSDKVATHIRNCDAGLWMQYCTNLGEAIFVISDGRSVSRCTVTHVSQEGAERIADECSDSLSALDEPQFRAAVVRALGATVRTMQ